jgi:acyl-CoA thioesterase
MESNMTTPSDHKELMQVFMNDQFAGYVGIVIEDVSPGLAKVKFDVQEHHLNGLGCVHGGMLFTLADMAFAVAANSHGQIAVSLNSSISYIKPAKGHTIFASAKEMSKSGRHAVYNIKVTDDAGAVVAIFQGMAYLKKESGG